MYLKNKDMLSPASAENVKDYIIFSWPESYGLVFHSDNCLVTRKGMGNVAAVKPRSEAVK